MKRYTYSLVLNNKIPSAINIIKKNEKKKNSDFFEANLLLIIDNLKKDNLDQAYLYSQEINTSSLQDRFEIALVTTLKQYIYVFKEKKILNTKENFGKLSSISETFQRCYLGEKSTDTFFRNLFNDPRNDYSRYIFFYLSYLIENKRLVEAENIVNEIEYINSTLILSQ